LEDNDANEFPINLQLDNTCPGFENKKQFFKKEYEFSKKFRIGENILDYQVVDFFSFLRFILFEGEHEVLTKIINDNSHISFEDAVPCFYLISPINLENELKVLGKIEEIMLTALNKYTTTFEEDEQILKNGELTSNQINCICMRMCEKKVINFYLSFAKLCLCMFTMDDEEVLFN